MLSVTLENTGKQFSDAWIYRRISFRIPSGDRLCLSGPNGSGKSTLLQMIAGYITATEGTVSWNIDGKPLPRDEVFRMVAFAAPYLDLIESFSLHENIRFYMKCKPFRPGMDARQLLQMTGLSSHAGKLLRDFSSGMKQRLKLALAFAADTPLLLLDEPLSNLDDSGAQWYRNLVKELPAGQTVVVCSNKPEDEAFFCSHSLHLPDYRIPVS